MPPVANWLLGGFQYYVTRYLRRGFHAVAALNDPPTIPASRPLIVYANHASWWDPMLGLFLAQRCFPERTLYAPIDARALERYGILKRMGFYGVDLSSRRGAADFLRTSQAILARPASSIWMTPQGRFVDVRDHQANFQPGLGHLAERLDEGVLLPLAAEYPFWEERLPEVLVAWGQPLDIASHPEWDKPTWTRAAEAALAAAQAGLAEASIARRSEAFRVLLGGRAGVGAIYDGLRRIAATMRGRPFQPQHGQKLGGEPGTPTRPDSRT